LPRWSSGGLGLLGRSRRAVRWAGDRPQRVSAGASRRSASGLSSLTPGFRPQCSPGVVACRPARRSSDISRSRNCGTGRHRQAQATTIPALPVCPNEKEAAHAGDPVPEWLRTKPLCPCAKSAIHNINGQWLCETCFQAGTEMWDLLDRAVEVREAGLPNDRRESPLEQHLQRKG
jgi:hypothetical protein